MGNVPNQDKRSKNFIPSVTEIGSHILFFLAKNFPESSHWNLFVLVIVHIVFILDCNIYRWAESKVSRYFAQKNFTAAIESARKTLDSGLNNPVTTEAHKKTSESN